MTFPLRGFILHTVRRTYTMEAVMARQKQAEELVARLTQQMTMLKEFAAKNESSLAERECENLREKNANLSAEIASMKTELAYWEAQNGVKQVSVPRIKPKQVQ